MASVFGFIPPRPEVWGGGRKEGREGRRDGERGKKEWRKRAEQRERGKEEGAKRQCKRGN